jgi:hypothetical protein
MIEFRKYIYQVQIINDAEDANYSFLTTSAT